MGNEKESSSSSSVLLTPKNEPRTIPKKVAATHNTKMGVWLGLFFHPTHSLYTHQTGEKKSKCHGESGLPRRKKEKSKKQQTIPPDDVSSTGEKKMGDSEAGRKKSWRKTEGVPFSYFEGISLKAQDIACCFQQSAKEYLLCSSVRVPNFFREMQLVSQQRSSFFKPKKEGRPKVARLSLWPRPLQKRWAAHTGRKKQNWQFLDEELLFSLLYLAFKLPSIFCQQKKVIWFFSPRKKSKMQNSCTSKSFFVPCIKHQVCHLRRG